MSQPWDNLPGWAQQVTGLIGAGGVSVIILKVIERVFARDDRIAVDRTTITGELRQDVRDLRAQIERLEARLDEAREENAKLQVEIGQLKVREQWVRNRYHRLANWLQTEPSIPTPPAWLFEDIPGPTMPESPA